MSSMWQPQQQQSQTCRLSKVISSRARDIISNGRNVSGGRDCAEPCSVLYCANCRVSASNVNGFFDYNGSNLLFNFQPGSSIKLDESVARVLIYTIENRYFK